MEWCRWLAWISGCRQGTHSGFVSATQRLLGGSVLCLTSQPGRYFGAVVSNPMPMTVAQGPSRRFWNWRRLSGDRSRPRPRLQSERRRMTFLWSNRRHGWRRRTWSCSCSHILLPPYSLSHVPDVQSLVDAKVDDRLLFLDFPAVGVDGFDREERRWNLDCSWLCQIRTGFAHGPNVVAGR